jgi:glycosyl transferase family 25
METQLQALGLDYHLFEAINGQRDWDTVRQHVDIHSFEKNVGREVMKGEIGCYLSHIGVWRAFLNSKHDIALILEDDVVFHDDFLVALQTAIKHADKWDMLKLNRIRAKFPIKQAVIGDYQLDAFMGSFTGMGAYLVNRSCVEGLLPKMLPILRPVDHALDRVHLRSFRNFALQPFPSSVDDRGESTITGAAFDNVRKFPIHKRQKVYSNRARALALKSIHLLMGKIGLYQ